MKTSVIISGPMGRNGQGIAQGKPDPPWAFIPGDRSLERAGHYERESSDRESVFYPSPEQRPQ